MNKSKIYNELVRLLPEPNAVISHRWLSPPALAKWPACLAQANIYRDVLIGDEFLSRILLATF
jgi:hypothetical protein